MSNSNQSDSNQKNQTSKQPDADQGNQSQKQQQSDQSQQKTGGNPQKDSNLKEHQEAPNTK